MMKMGCTQKEGSSALHHVLKKKKDYSKDALYAVLFESDQDRKHRHKLAEVTEIVNAHRLDEMKTFIEQHELTMWRRENGFDLQSVVRGKPPPTREEDNSTLRIEVQELKDAISVSTKYPDLPPDSCVVLKERVKPTLVATVQQCLDSPSDPCVILEDRESEKVMSPTLEENQQSSLTGTGTGMPEQQSTPKGGNLEAGLINTGGSVLVGMRSTPGIRVSAIDEAAINEHRQGSNNENKQFDPGGRRRAFPFPVINNYFNQLIRAAT